MDESAPYREAMHALLVEVVCGRHRPDIYDSKASGVGWKKAPAGTENPRFISPSTLTFTVARLGLTRMKSPEGVALTVDEHGRKIKRREGKKATGVSLTMVRNEVLANRNEQDHAAGRPWLTSIVCTAGDTPALSYFRDLERLRGVRLRSKDERAAYHHEELLRVLAYPWDALD
ncbi:MAG: hypothetical protein EON56_04540 [Alphaproteobacteria bacterium]|nr:MAG: hypothetical protein EON56_04540 [Alphaproteobacteria bacterium]